MGLSDKAFFECEENKDCDEINKREGISRDKACWMYQCRLDGNGCELRLKDWDDDGAYALECKDETNDSESLDCDDGDGENYPNNEEGDDSADNDCDGVIDEGVIAPSSEPLMEGLTGSTSVIISSGSDGTIAITRMVDFKVVLDIVSEGVRDEQSSGELGFGLDDPTQECPLEEGGSICKFVEIATAPIDLQGDTTWLAVAVNKSGCYVGQLRTIQIYPDNGQLLRPGDNSPGASNLTNGIDVFDSTSCSGKNREGGNPGAVAINIAAQNPGGSNPQALIAWIGDGQNRGNGCTGPIAPIEILSIWLDDDVINGANNAIPLQIGTTSGSSKPAIATRTQSDSGFFVAYSDATGAIVLHFINALQTTNANEEPRLGDRFVGIGRGDRIAIAPATTMQPVCASQETGFRIGITWLQDCKSDSPKAMFATISYGIETDSFCDPSEAVALGETVAGNSPGPALVYIECGFLVPGFKRDGRTVTTQDDGGWVVSWISGEGDANALIARRISELDSQPVDDEERIAISNKDRYGNIALYLSGDRKAVRFVYHSLGSQSIFGGSL
jgi:hypothetical protein